MMDYAYCSESLFVCESLLYTYMIGDKVNKHITQLLLEPLVNDYIVNKIFNDVHEFCRFMTVTHETYNMKHLSEDIEDHEPVIYVVDK